MILDVLNDTMKFIKTFCCLRIQINITIKIKLDDIVKAFDDYSMTFCLSAKTSSLRMTILSEDDNLSIRIIVKLLFDSSL